MWYGRKMGQICSLGHKVKPYLVSWIYLKRRLNWMSFYRKSPSTNGEIPKARISYEKSNKDTCFWNFPICRWTLSVKRHPNMAAIRERERNRRRKDADKSAGQNCPQSGGAPPSQRPLAPTPRRSLEFSPS